MVLRLLLFPPRFQSLHLQGTMEEACANWRRFLLTITLMSTSNASFLIQSRLFQA